MSVPYYQDELVTLYHGDAREITEWTEADVLVTDPPYGIRWRSNSFKGGRIKNIENDDDTSSRDAVLDLWGPDRRAIVFGSFMAPPPPGVRRVCVYAKPADTGTIAVIGGVRSDVEAIFLVGREWPCETFPREHRSAVFTTRHASLMSVRWSGPRHPHIKPQDVMRALVDLTPAGAVIADPFAGSGATLYAAVDQGRRAIGVEIDEAYCEAIARRLSQGAFDFSQLGGGGGE